MEPNKKYTVTLNEWTYAPDGKSYKVIYGTFLEKIDNDVKIGCFTIPKHGIHSYFESEEYEAGNVIHDEWGHGYKDSYERPTVIYNADRKFTKEKHVKLIKEIL